MKRYNPKAIEPKWQQSWADARLYAAKDFDERQKFVMLTEFPYPSGVGIHLGHVREYTYGDMIARHKRMQGYNVLYPMGYDAFGLPTENFAIKNKISPQKATEQNVANFQSQLEQMGYGIDWSRSFRTSDPEYYKWTQWLFLRFFEAGLAYQDDIAINWCPHCKTGLANEEVANGRHERCDTIVEKKQLKQWVLQITKYADRLIDGLQDVDYPSRIADQQVNWIGRSKGAEVIFKVQDSGQDIKVFTTRPDTLFGATFLALAPEHELVRQITTEAHRGTVMSYVKLAGAKTDIERQDASREKTGVFTGAYAINPASGQPVPIWVADYVLVNYGTGAIMAVPAHDERDFAFAEKFGIPIRQVIAEQFVHAENVHQPDAETVPRQVVTCVVRHPSEDKYLVVRPTGSQFWAPLMGGIEGDETAVEAARRELAEESGYTDIANVEEKAEVLCSEYYAQHKHQNRIAYCHTVVVQLASLQKREMSAEEEAAQESKWVSSAEAKIQCRGAGAKEIFEMGEDARRDLVHEGRLINSGAYDGLLTAEAREKIIADLAEKGAASERVNYKLRDWIFSRQHYWGEPIPIIHCDQHGPVPVPDDQLPVTLPTVDHYEPTDTGESPLASITAWVNTTCPICAKPAKRETDTMPNWAGSSWYYLRYFDAHNDQAFADRKKLEYWGAVDLYLGGMEHTTLHLLYSRFWHEFLFDQGLVPTPEPYSARRGQGIILAADGTKMSKSKGNVVNPTEVIDSGYGADALRLATAFLAPYDQTTSWSPESVAGTFRFLQRVWNITQEVIETADVSDNHGDITDDIALRRVMHRAIRRVSKDLQEMNFNTAIAALMETINELYKLRATVPIAVHHQTWHWAVTALSQLLAPLAPHITEELWSELSPGGSIHTSPWPAYDQQYLTSDHMTIVVQVNGKVRAQLSVDRDAEKDHILELARTGPKVAEYLAGQAVKKSIYVPGKIVNFVI